MPDVWTLNPTKLLTAIEASGGRCGVEPRVLLDRDPNWTCHIDTPTVLYDIYIHDAAGILFSSWYLSFTVLIGCGGVIAGLLWGKRFWKMR